VSWRLFKFHKLEISVHPYFLLLIFLWILSGLPFQTLFLFILVLGHELTHTIVAKMCGLEVSKVELFPFGE
jgi:stage IV sporulation protein FB